MFILFGWGRQTVKNHGPVFAKQCDRCNNKEFWHLYTRRTWFTLFFIPIIPYSTEHLVVCPVCSYGAVIKNEKFKELKEIAERNMNIVNENKKLDEESLKDKLIQFSNSDNTNSYNSGDNYNYSGKTETQINYLKQMEEIRRAKEEAERAQREVSED